MSLLDQFESISLNELDALSLQNRQDTKYILHAPRLPDLLIKMQETHRILEINNQRLFTYNNIYFDTSSLRCYIDHHNARVNRYKVRIREYAETGDFFFEIKRKTNKDRTVKQRIHLNSITGDPTALTQKFVKEYSPFDLYDLKERAHTDFQRMTFASFEQGHRITIDQNLTLYKPGGQKRVVEGLVIIELKQGRASGRSPLWYALRDVGAKEVSVSKYILANNLIDPNIKANRFKPRNRMINKICYASIHT